MAEVDLRTVDLRDEFYRDSFGKVIIIFLSLSLAVVFLTVLSFYLYLQEPQPLSFLMQNDQWRIQQEVPLTEPLLTEDNVLQWVNDVFNQAFILDFIHYHDQIQKYQTYFTENGWNVFLNHINNYANYNLVHNNRLFVTSTPTGVASLINRNILAGRYYWIVELPLTINYAGMSPPAAANLILQVRIVRVPTLNNLTGIGIDDVIILNAAASKANTNRTVSTPIRTGSIR